MENFNALLTLNEIKTLYSGKPVGICPLYKGSIGATKAFETTGNPVVIPKYVSLEKLAIDFSPKQAGTGDPSPDNVRAISGWDSVKVTISNESESHDYDITLPETIYGGTVDGVTGEGAKTIHRVVLDGTEKWVLNAQMGASGINGYQTPLEFLADESYVCICSHFGGMMWDGVLKENSVAVTSAVMVVRTNGSDTLDNWKSYLSAQATAGTPVQVAYKLATPEPFEISQVSIPSLGGENKFFTNGENMDIIYNETSFWG